MQVSIFSRISARLNQVKYSFSHAFLVDSLFFLFFVDREDSFLSLQLLDRRSAHIHSLSLARSLHKERDEKKREREREKKKIRTDSLFPLSLLLSSSFAHSTTYTEVGREREKRVRSLKDSFLSITTNAD